MTIARAHHGLLMQVASDPPDPVEGENVFPTLDGAWTLLNYTMTLQSYPAANAGWTQLDYV